MLGQGVTLGKALGGLWVSSMGLNRSKSMSGEFPNKVPSSTSKAKEKQQGLVSQDPTHSSSTTPDCSVFKKTRKSLRSIVEDQPGKSTGSKEKRKKQLIPKIIITPASSDENSSSELEEKEQKTIRDQTDYGPYYRHRNPSTIEAYQVDPRDK
ncbi:spermatogenesis-associated protein 33 isoform X2 [Ornithorhynchus anatinus]|uniref:spermatogenesis-associated protein 33 isoform X2 n=1 Tax=Ornithorhynchus anatinus TaxID=9258 RepID=UPI0010A82E88|nr:spermatogenesis-associated protein 33 isoform X2 [Ornithorhynchus anatinus]